MTKILKIRINTFAALLILLFGCITLDAYAQRQEFTLQGVAYRKNATQRLAKVLISDKVNGALAATDDLGVFEIKCAVGDTLLFKLQDYTDQKVAVANPNILMVYMIPVINMQQVDIKDATKKQELNQVMKDYNKQGIYGNGKTSALGAIASPLNAVYDLFGSGPKQARRFQKYSKIELEQSEVDRRFTKKLVRQSINLRDDQVQPFMNAYRPTYADVKKWNDYDLVNYIKKSAADFEANGGKPPSLQKLVADSVPPTFKH